MGDAVGITCYSRGAYLAMMACATCTPSTAALIIPPA
jgi:hypothetical protein